MQITFPYNEILPTRKAHDYFLVREATEFASARESVSLIVGHGSRSLTQLQSHYGLFPSPLHLLTLPILRKNYGLNISWNWPFFYATRRYLRLHPPDVIIMSVLKQAADLLRHRQPGIYHIYEAHELAAYPNTPPRPHFAQEKWVLEQADLICVTTHALKQLLQQAPYTIRTPIAVLPLAVDATPLPPPPLALPPTLAYVGQLYKEQGIAELLTAMDHLPDVHLRIIGGRPHEIIQLNRQQPNVSFEGYLPPSLLREALCATHAFIAPFQLVDRMPYVAHTKLYEYLAWGRCIVAPDAPIVREHLPKSTLLYRPGHLVDAIRHALSSPLPAPILSPWSERIIHYLQLLNNRPS